MRNRTYGGVRGRKTKVGRKLLRFPPTRFVYRFLCDNFYRIIRLFKAYLYQNKNGHKVELLDTYLFLLTVFKGDKKVRAYPLLDSLSPLMLRSELNVRIELQNNRTILCNLGLSHESRII